MCYLKVDILFLKQLRTLRMKAVSDVYLGISWINPFCKGHSLILGADHASDGHVLGELQFSDALKALLQMGLDTQWVFGL